MLIKSAYAAIRNPVIDRATDPGAAGAGLAFYIAQLWKTIVVVGGLAFLLYFVLGGIEWTTAGGDKNKVEEAQKKLTNGFIGLVILVGSYAIIAFIQDVLGLSILNIDWTFGGGAASPTGGGGGGFSQPLMQ